MKVNSKKWLEWSIKDFENAVLGSKWKKSDIAAFYAQQCVEKAPKAVYIKKFKELIGTHDLKLLGEKVRLPKNLLRKCSALSKAYVVTRYPDVAEVYSPEEIEFFLKICEM